ncbi:MAG: CDP-alcohol phosphatidyltransferase family protein [Candidatus Delongbacteria bacterium]|nr:CDP-alcohol phosphatidyltransferase family protein [Candidatus Delongbacteria bacterium]
MLLNKFKENYNKLKYLQKGSLGTPAYTRYINRWFGRLFASFIALFEITPNAISLLSSIITLISFILFLLLNKIHFFTSLVLVILLMLGYALDSADGQLSRLLIKQSKRGEWLDHTLDAIKIPLGHGVAIFYIINTWAINHSWFVLYLILLSLTSGRFLSNILKTKLIDYKSKKSQVDSTNNDVIKSILLLPEDYGVYILLFLFTCKPNLFFVAYTIWGSIIILLSIFGLIKSWRDFSAETI